MLTRNVKINLKERSYDISIGVDIFHLIADIAPKKAFIITDDNVEPYAKTVQNIILGAGAEFCEILTFPHGEKAKSYNNLQKAHDWMLENNIHRNSVVFAVGGGVVGDLAGFAAATIMRGVEFVQVPTSLLSQVDSSVGGKTGINTKHGKNLVGAFYQPKAVIIDISSLKTLPKRELLAGYAEIVKYGLIDNLEFFDWLENNSDAVLSLDESAITHAIEVSCKAKAAIVEADEREQGRRALLNLGHTFGHALEAAAGYDGSLIHGEAVAIGTVMAFDLSAAMGLCSLKDAARVRVHFESVGLPVHAGNINATSGELISIMRRDKKALDNNMVFILVNAIGDAFISKEVKINMVCDVLSKSLAGCDSGRI